MTNAEVAKVLSEVGTILEIRGENPFKCRAFHNAARMLSSATVDLAEAAKAGTLTTIPGIGKGIAPIVADLALTGASREADEVRSSVPAGVVAMLAIQGLGPAKVRLLHAELGIDSPAKLREAAAAGRLAAIRKFGKKTEDNILRGLDLLDRHAGKRLYPEAEAVAASMADFVRSIPGVTACEPAGSVRRRMEIVGDVDLVASAAKGKAPGIIAKFLSHPGVASVLGSGPTRGSALFDGGLQCDLRVVSPAEYPFALQYFTGSREHNVELRSLAREKGWSLNEYGFTRISPPDGGRTRASGKKVPPPPSCHTEDDIYRALGLKPIPAELREASGEIHAARAGELPRLITVGDLRGTFHCHTTWSDGRNSLKEMADGAIASGWEYLGIADHSKAAAYAGGLSEKDVRRQLAEIETFNASARGFRLFAGTEVDILPDGSLDWSDRVLAGFDYVVASVHSKFGMTAAEATKRVISAVKHKHVTMLGHPTGRLLLGREGYPVDVRQVIDAAADHGTMIEINANPHRLDLDWRFCRYAAEKGVMIVVNPDAHAVSGLSEVRFGINVARKGWLTASQVLNTRPLAEVARLLA